MGRSRFAFRLVFADLVMGQGLQVPVLVEDLELVVELVDAVAVVSVADAP